MLVKTLSLLLVSGILLPVYANVDPQNYSLSGGDEIVIELSREELNFDITKVQYRGTDTPLNTLETFFYFGQINDLRSIIDMHYEEDGSRRYISEVLFRDQSAFSGAENLKSLKINYLYYWGKHNIVDFYIVDKTNETVAWYEDFICSQDVCSKSNYLNIFGSSEEKRLFSYIYNSPKKSVGNSDLSDYFKIILDSVDASSKYPIRIFYKIKKASKGVKQPKWYDILRKIEDIDLDSLGKLEFLEPYIPTIFEDWNESELASFDFSGARREKEFIIQSLAVNSNFKVKSYLESDEKVWVFASAIDSSGDSRRYLFVFNKKSSLFQLQTPVGDQSKTIDRMLRNQIFENALFQSNDGDNREVKYSPSFDDETIRNFYANLKVIDLSSPYNYMGFVLLGIIVIGVVVMALFYIYFFRKHADRLLPGFLRKRQ